MTRLGRTTRRRLLGLAWAVPIALGAAPESVHGQQHGTIPGLVVARDHQPRDSTGTAPPKPEPVTIRRNPWLSGADLHVFADGTTVLVRPDGERVPLTVRKETCTDCWPGAHELTFYDFPDGMTIVERPHGSQWEVRYPRTPLVAREDPKGVVPPAPTAALAVDLKNVAPADVTPGFVLGASRSDPHQLFLGKLRRVRLLRSGGGNAKSVETPGGALRGADEGPLELYLTSTGTSTGEAFDAVLAPRDSGPVELAETVVVVEPVRLSSSDQKRHADLARRALEGPGAVRTTLEAYCLELTKEVPPAGMAFRLAPRAVQERFASLRGLPDAARRLFDQGRLHPDSDPQEYFHSILQWAIWSRQERLDADGFRDAFLEHARKNVEAAGQAWTKELRGAVEELVPNRWNDVQAVLASGGAAG